MYLCEWREDLINQACSSVFHTFAILTGTWPLVNTAGVNTGDRSRVHNAYITLHSLKSEVMDGSATVYIMKATNGGGLPECSTKVILALLSDLKATLLLLAIKFTLSLLVSGATRRIRQSERKWWLIIDHDKQTILIQVFLITYAVITQRHNGRKWWCECAALMHDKVLTFLYNSQTSTLTFITYSLGLCLICRSCGAI